MVRGIQAETLTSDCSRKGAAWSDQENNFSLFLKLYWQIGQSPGSSRIGARIPLYGNSARADYRKIIRAGKTVASNEK
jgi:hypothetical protein